MGLLFIAVSLPFAGALIVATASSRHSRRAGVIASLTALLSFVACVWAFLSLKGGTGFASFGWIPELGLAFSLLADGLSLTFALLVSSLGAIICAYATVYLDGSENIRRFFVFLLLFMGAMMGTVLSANLISLFVFWEMTSVTSFLLIGYWHERDRSRYGALKALVVTGSGGLALLVAFVMLGLACGSFEIPVVLQRSEALLDSPWAVPAAALIIVGAITKSAQFPFHLWLPSAMEAPTPVSAYLHAATMVKAGLYLVARLGPLMAAVSFWTPVLATLGIVTMFWGGLMALRQRDLKALLAFSTVSQLGLIMALLAPADTASAAVGVFHLINHASFKGALFLLVGVIEHSLHTRDLMSMGPLRRSMPRSWVLLAVAALAMAGVPPLGGFVSKEMFLETMMGGPFLMALVAVVGSVLTAGYSLALVAGLARGRRGDASVGRDPGLGLLWGPALLVVVTVLLGLFPEALVGDLVTAASRAASSASSAADIHLALWHGFTPNLLLSASIIACGALLYRCWWITRVPVAPRLISDRLYDRFLAELERRSKQLTSLYMSGLLWRYCATVLWVLCASVAAFLLSAGLPAVGPWADRAALPFEYLVCGVALAAAIGTAVATTRLAAILALGASGFSIALLFALLSAPDLALTQIMVETVSVALFLAAFAYLPPYAAVRKRRPRFGHMLLSCLVGFGSTVLLASARSQRGASRLAEFFRDSSVEAAGGHNIVNVILVDFRGLDTFGEITVLGIAALACFAIIKLRGSKEVNR